MFKKAFLFLTILCCNHVFSQTYQLKSPDGNIELDISIENNILYIKGESEKKSEVEDKNYYRKEIRQGSFFRSVPLPTRVVGDKASASVEDGVLKIVIPKAPKAKPKSIKIKTKKTK